MIYPTIVVDDFFKYPNNIKKLSQDLIYEKDKDGKWPGERSKPIHQTNYDFFNFFNQKILSLIYPQNYLQIHFTANTFFQKISGERYPHTGWVHKDTPSEITAIVYLSNHDNCGTAIWKKINFYNEHVTSLQKHNYYKKDFFDKEQLKLINNHNSNYKKILSVNSLFNRILIFDSSQNHSAESFVDKNLNEDRLTLITFIEKINLVNEQIKYPIAECNRLE